MVLVVLTVSVLRTNGLIRWHGRSALWGGAQLESRVLTALPEGQQPSLLQVHARLASVPWVSLCVHASRCVCKARFSWERLTSTVRQDHRESSFTSEESMFVQQPLT